MAFTLDTKALSTEQSTNPVTLSFTCASGTKVLVICLMLQGSSLPTRTGTPTYNSINFDGGVNYPGGADGYVETWYKLNPSTGSSYTISVPNSQGYTISISAASFTNTVSVLYDDDVAVGSTGTNPSTNINTTENGNLIVGVVYDAYRTACTPGANYTEMHTLDAGSFTFTSEYDLDAGAPGTKALNFVNSNSDSWRITGYSFKIQTTPASGSLHAYTTGVGKPSFSKSGYVYGADSDPSISYAVLLVGGISGNSASDSQFAYTNGSGVIPASDLQNAYTKGQSITNDSQNAYVSGVAEAVDNQIAYVKGKDISLDSQLVYTKGQSILLDSQPAFTKGQISISDSQSAFVKGSIVSIDNQYAFTKGLSTNLSSIHAYVEGQTGGAVDSQPAFVQGKASISDSQFVYTKGQSLVNDSQNAYVNGQLGGSVDSQLAFTLGLGDGLTPDADASSQGTWKNEVGGTSNLYLSIDEYPTPNDNDYIYPEIPVSGDYYECSLSSGIEGEGDVVLFWRGSGVGDITVQLREGSTVIASHVVTLSYTIRTYYLTLSPAEKANITNWNDLRIRFIPPN